MSLYHKAKGLYLACFFQLTLFFVMSTLAANEEIVVRLATESTRLALFIEAIQNEKAAFDANYLQTLSSIFSYDMNYNGMTEVVLPQDKKRYQLLNSQIGFETDCDFNACKDVDVFYVIKMKMEGKNLVTKVISVNGKSTKLIEGITCTGELAKDRKAIHHLADSICQMLFQKQGVASSRIFFTEKKKVQVSPEGDQKLVAEIYEADYDGANKKMLTHDSTFCATPVYVAPNAQSQSASLVFVSYKIGQPKIYFTSLKDGKTKRATPLRGNQITPQISPDGTKIAFACDTMGRSDIFLQTFNAATGAIGKPLQIFTAKGAANASPTFSPDSNKIAFVSNKDGSPKIYVMDIPEANAKLKDIHPELISKRCRENSAPCWSPDGKKIAYSAKSNGARQIWIYDLESGQERQLTDGKGDKENPVWAANSLHLLFNSTKDEATSLYLVNLNQPEAVKIKVSDTSNEIRFPCWKQ